MQELTLNNGNKMPIVGLGTWNSEKTKVAEAVEFALSEADYKHLDCASIYGNEKEVGDGLQAALAKGVEREDIFITSKLWNTEHDPEAVKIACKATMDNLQVDYLDLYLVHWMVPFVSGGEKEPLDENGVVITQKTPLHETWAAMEELVKEGLVKSIGVANASVMSLLDMMAYAKIQPAVNQIELHPYNIQDDLVEFCQQNNIQVTAYSPLGTPGGLDAGEPVLLEEDVLKDIAREVNRTSAQVLLKWGLQRNTIVIPKSTDPSHIENNIALFDFELSEVQMQKLSGLNKDYRFVDPVKWWGIPYFK